jgi:hypothetical protein
MFLPSSIFLGLIYGEIVSLAKELTIDVLELPITLLVYPDYLA